MTKTLRTIRNHRSIRNYHERDLEPGQLEAILEAARTMPTSVNGQQVSVVVVRDQEKKQKIAALAGGQPWIAQAPVFLVFMVDFHKTSRALGKNQTTQVIHESAEGTVMGTFDTGLAMGGAIVAAESLGLGIVPIGGIRRDPQAMIDLLGLPRFTYPVAGLVVGHPQDLSATKPRLPPGGFVHEEQYDVGAVDKAIDEYDLTMGDYYRNRGDKATDWSSQLSNLYKTVYYPKVLPTLVSQGFLLDK